MDYLDLIVKYSGDIIGLAQTLGGHAEILSDNFAIVTLAEDKIGELQKSEIVQYTEPPKDLSRLLSESLYAACMGNTAAGAEYTGRGVLIALPDSGIDYTHPDFRNPDGTTRIEYLWDMTIPGNPPPGFNTGSLFTAADINAALAAPNPLEIVPSADFIGHGTAVAGVAAGNGAASGGAERGAAPEAGIIAIKLGREGGVRSARTVELMRGLKFAVDAAQGLDMPLVINISYGTNQGAHDGESLFEEFVNEIADGYRVAVVVAAGNEGSAGHHFAGHIDTGERADAEFSIAGGIREMNMVMVQDFADIFTYELISPSGRSSGILDSYSNEYSRGFENTIVTISMGQPTHYNPNQELIFHFAANSGEGFISPGLWQLIITSRQSVLGDFNIWLPTTEEVGRRTGFSRPNPANTLTIPATAANVISVGGYNSADMAAAEFTGRGSGQMQKPDIVAPGVNVLSAKAGGGYDSFSGTSIAAPFAAGAAAALMEWAIVQGNDPDLYGQRLKAFLRLGAKRDPARQYPNNIWGYGTLCFANTLSYLQESHAPILAAARTNTSEYANMPMHEFVQNQNIIDVIVPNSSRLHEYAAEHPDIRIVANFCDNIALVYLPHENLDEFLDAVEANFIRAIAKPMGLLGRTSLIASGILQVQQRPYLDLRGRGVIVGFIDTGIDYTQPSFLYEDGSSKIKYIWDQTIEGQAAPDLLMGSEYSQEQINNALRSDNPYTIVPTRDTVGHGTFLASVAAGREDNEYLGAAPDAEIIAVKLRPLKDFYRQRFHIPSHIDEAYSTFDCMLGVKYILNKAAQLGRPAAICFSLGSTFGSHDGFNLIEEYLTECGRKRGVSISVAAGNESNTKGHTHGRLEKNGDTATIEVRVEENAPSMAMLFWNRPVDYMYITVKSPTGEIVGRAPGMKDIRFTQKLVLEKSTVNINYFFPIAGLGEDIIELFIDRPTPGIWTITLHGDIILDGGYHAWMPLSNFRQSGVEFITPTPQYTITIPGTAVGVITCGAYDQKNNSLYAASSWGPTRLPSPAPDLAAPGVDVLGAYPWGYGTMSGTSVAAAITTGAAALMLQWGIIDDHYKNLNNLRIRAFLQQGCTRDPGATYPSDQWGYGRLDLMQTFNILRSQY